MISVPQTGVGEGRFPKELLSSRLENSSGPRRFARRVAQQHFVVLSTQLCLPCDTSPEVTNFDSKPGHERTIGDAH
jgi:hypothetical protein